MCVPYIPLLCADLFGVLSVHRLLRDWYVAVLAQRAGDAPLCKQLYAVRQSALPPPVADGYAQYVGLCGLYQ